MNRLKNTRCYLSGGIEFEPDLGVGWREIIKKELRDLEIIWLDPCKKPIDLGFEDLTSIERRKELRREGKWEEVAEQMKIIRCVDLRMVGISDFLIVNIDTSIHTCGTYEEVFLANRQKKPVIVRIKQGKQGCPDWLLGTLPHQMIFSTWNEVLTYLINVAYSQRIDHYKRWWFFTFNGVK